MNSKNKFSRSSHKDGQILLEVLATLMITSFISVTGFHWVSSNLEYLSHRRDQEKDFLKHQLMIEDMQNAMDARYLNPFSEDPWFILDTATGTDWFLLKSLKVLVIENGKPRLWEWNLTSYKSVYINQASGQYYSHQEPDRIEVRFPEAKSLHFREGVAIEAFW